MRTVYTPTTLYREEQKESRLIMMPMKLRSETGALWVSLKLRLVHAEEHETETGEIKGFRYLRPALKPWVS